MFVCVLNFNVKPKKKIKKRRDNTFHIKTNQDKHDTLRRYFNLVLCKLSNKKHLSVFNTPYI